MCTKQDQEREQSFQLPVSHTLNDHHNQPWCQAAWAPCQELKFFLLSMYCMSMDSITEVFYHLKKILIATKHIADNNLCLSGRQRTGTSCMQHSPNLSASLFFRPMTPTAQM